MKHLFLSLALVCSCVAFVGCQESVESQSSVSPASRAFDGETLPVQLQGVTSNRPVSGTT